MFDKKALLEIINNSPQPFIKIAKKMNIKRKDNRDFSLFLKDLVRKNEISTTNNREYFIPKIVKTITGQIRLNSKGFGFIDLTDEESIFVSPPNVNFAMDKDTVNADVFIDPMDSSRKQGVVKKIITRNRKSFVGRVAKFGDNFGIIPVDAKINGRFRFDDTSNLKVDDEIKVEIVSYGFISKIKMVKKLGHKDDVSIDILMEIEDANVPMEFSRDAQVEAHKLPNEINKEDIEGRHDLRGDMIVTIDGDDTKDFDDAISIKFNEKNNYVLGVHIADVSHYVKEEKPLDKDAKSRATSIYLADRVIPMLPVELSNGICSLNPQVDRLTITAEIEIDKDGNNISYKVYPSVIKSKFRLTYQEVNNFYRNEFSWDNDELHQMLKDALELSKVIRKFKKDEGYIDFEIEESKIIIDENGKTVDIVPRDRFESEKMIEDFMVRANEVVAHYAEKNDFPFIYRVHDKPDLDRVTNLQNVVKVLGMDVSIPRTPVPKEFAKAINDIKKTRFDTFMKVMLLRTMAKAEYSSQNIGHFGLASKSYTHFTSPIRRYPDLMVHRMLREYFFKKNNKAKGHFSSILPEIAEHCSEAEQKAINLERRVADIKKAEYYEELIGKSFDGIIVSVSKFGFFVEFPNKVDGLVHSSSLLDGEYKLSQNGYSLKSDSKVFTVGDKVNATIVGAIKSEGKIDLVLTEMYEMWKEKNLRMMKNRKY